VYAFALKPCRTVRSYDCPQFKRRANGSLEYSENVMSDLNGVATRDARDRSLLEASGTITLHPNVSAVLTTISSLLSKFIPFESVALVLRDEKRGVLQFHTLGTGATRGPNEITEVLLPGTALQQVIEEQIPVFIEEVEAEFFKIPELRSSLERHEKITIAYALPISTSRDELGALVVGSKRAGEFSQDELESMRSLAAHVSVALDSALGFQVAEKYQRELARERDRLSLLLEVNNHVISHLEIYDLFRAASVSIRKFLHNDLTGFWLFDGDLKRLECVVFDVFATPDSPDLTQVSVGDFTDSQLQEMRLRIPRLWSEENFQELPSEVQQQLGIRGIKTLLACSLVSERGPIGVLTVGSRRAHAFSQEDCDLIMQLSTQLSLVLDNALAYGRVEALRRRLEDERLYLESEIGSEHNFGNIVGRSSALKAVLDQIKIAAPTNSTILLHGETGTGKELIARAIHQLSPRRDRTFVKLNCAAIPSGLIESELFGHEKGAFTGALMQKRGRFEVAHQGTLFLDEIGDISIDLQPKLLRALQEQEFERLGSSKTVHVDVRLIAATHRDLEAMIRDGEFREDLFYRLNVFPVEIPPLRERREDIPLLVQSFVSKLSREMRKSIKSIPKDAMDALTNADWPGNIRELENFIERAVILTKGEDLYVPVAQLKKSSAPFRRDPNKAARSFRDSEREAIIEALKASSGKISGPGGAADILGLNRTTLQNKMNKLGITKADYQAFTVGRPRR
jgi:formate hydrogenlyase transcriptional activator